MEFTKTCTKVSMSIIIHANKTKLLVVEIQIRLHFIRCFTCKIKPAHIECFHECFVLTAIVFQIIFDDGGIISLIFSFCHMAVATRYHKIIFCFVMNTYCFNLGDVEMDAGIRFATAWPPAPTKRLITLYQKFQEEMDDRKTKKKDVWLKITNELNELGYTYTQIQVETKWNNLLKSHKDIGVNKQKTGAKRKSFHYYEEMESIVAKRHDIHPPFVSGSTITSTPADDSPAVPEITKKFVAKPLASSSSNALDTEAAGKESSLNLSGTDSATKRRKHRKQQSEQNNIPLQQLQLLKDADNRRTQQHVDREANKDRRAQERNDLLRDLLSVLKD